MITVRRLSRRRGGIVATTITLSIATTITAVAIAAPRWLAVIGLSSSWRVTTTTIPTAVTSFTLVSGPTSITGWTFSSCIRVGSWVWNSFHLSLNEGRVLSGMTKKHFYVSASNAFSILFDSLVCVYLACEEHEGFAGLSSTIKYSLYTVGNDLLISEEVLDVEIVRLERNASDLHDTDA